MASAARQIVAVKQIHGVINAVSVDLPPQERVSKKDDSVVDHVIVIIAIPVVAEQDHSILDRSVSIEAASGNVISIIAGHVGMVTDSWVGGMRVITDRQHPLQVDILLRAQEALAQAKG